MKITTFFFFAFFIFGAFFAPEKTQANIDDFVIMNVKPNNIKPNKETRLTLVSYNIDLNRTEISWYKDGELVLSGIGKTQFSFMNKDLGMKTVVTAYADKYKISKTFIPAEIDILWEAVDSYTPPFYKGKALASSESRIRVVAIPHLISLDGLKLDKNKLVYKWKKNRKYRDLNKQSGYGKDSIEFTQSLLLNNELITVEASSLDNKISFSENKLIKKTNPEIIIYQDHPLKGVEYEKALTEDIFMKNKEITLVAEPYYFSNNGFNLDNLVFNWYLNNKKINSGNSENKMTFGFEKEMEGVSKVSLNIKHIEKILQFAKSNTISLLYGKNNLFFNTIF